MRTDEEILIKISEWHDLSSDHPDAKLEVYEYLDMSWEEYRLWATRMINTLS